MTKFICTLATLLLLGINSVYATKQLTDDASAACSVQGSPLQAVYGPPPVYTALDPLTHPIPSAPPAEEEKPTAAAVRLKKLLSDEQIIKKGRIVLGVGAGLLAFYATCKWVGGVMHRNVVDDSRQFLPKVRSYYNQIPQDVISGFSEALIRNIRARLSH